MCDSNDSVQAGTVEDNVSKEAPIDSDVLSDNSQRITVAGGKGFETLSQAPEAYCTHYCRVMNDGSG